MTKSTVVFTQNTNSAEAGKILGEEISRNFDSETPDVVILFASSTYNYEELLKALNQSCRPKCLIGASSAGEFTNTEFSTDAASAVAIRSSNMKFSAGLGQGIKENKDEAIEGLANALSGKKSYEYRFHSALILADALSGHTDEIIEVLSEKTLGTYQFFGGGAGDNANFQKTHVFFGEKAYTDSAVILEILSNKPIGLGVKHGWKPASKKMRVTAAEGMKLISVNAMPAVEAFKEFAEENKLDFNPDDPIPFFLHNILGIEVGDEFKLRVPLVINSDGSMICASDIPVGASIYIMNIEKDAATKAAHSATEMAMNSLEGNKPGVALFFDCVATRLRMGQDFGIELNEVKNTLGDIDFAGCNTYGQVARINGQFSGFHNCTAVVCVIPE